MRNFFGGFITDLWPKVGHPPLRSALHDVRSTDSSVGIGLPSLFSSPLSNSLAAAAFAAIDKSHVLNARTSSNMSDADYGICNACLQKQIEI